MSASDGNTLDALGNRFSELSCFSSSNGRDRERIIVPRKEDAYNMGHARRGLAVIFSHETFNIHDPFKKYNPRKGTKFDHDNLKGTLEKLEFDVDSYPDLTFKELDQKLKDLRKKDFTDCDCLLIAVLTHGDAGNLLCAKDKQYVTSVLFDRFTADNCPTLTGKPKIFIINACQGEMLDDGVDVETDSGDGNYQQYRIPQQSDFLIAYSTVPKYVSWRNENEGTCYIRALCEELRRSWVNGSDILITLRNVNREVAFNYQSNTPSTPGKDKKKQMPYFVCMLTRSLIFAPKGSKANYLPLNNNNNNNNSYDAMKY